MQKSAVLGLALLLALFLVGCGSPVLQLEGELAAFEAEAVELGSDMLPDLEGWRVIVRPESQAIPCGGGLCLGVTTYDRKTKLAYIQLAFAEGWTLERTSFRHELTHVWLLATTGDGDAGHAGEVWRDMGGY